MIDDDKRLDVDVRLTMRQEILRAGDQEVADLINDGGSVTSKGALFGWLAKARIELPNARTADVVISRLDRDSDVLIGSGDPPFNAD